MKKKALREMGSLFLLTAAILIWVIVGACGGGGGGGSSSPSPTGTVNTSISDPPTCKAPNGSFSNVWVTITRVRAHKSPNADSNDSGWVELADLRGNPQQIDLLNLPSDNCILTMLGSQSGIPAGQYQQIRLYLLNNPPAAGENTPQNNMCDSGFNCVLLSGATETLPLQLSSEVQTGIKIPSGQIAGGRFTVPAGQAVDLNIDFDACSSIVPQGNGQYRLRPVLHAGEISRTTNAISGVVVDNNVAVENAIVFLEQKDPSDSTISRVVMRNSTDRKGNFIFCPLSAGPYDVVVGGEAGGKMYLPTITLDVAVGTAIGNIPLVETTTTPATINGQVKAAFASGQRVDIDIWALQNANASLRVTVPVLQGSTPNPVMVQDVPVDYHLLVPTANPPSFPIPLVRSLSIAGDLYHPAPDGNYFVNAQGPCTPSSQTIPPFSVSPEGSAIDKNFDFKDCSGS